MPISKKLKKSISTEEIIGKWGITYNWKILLSGYTPLYAYELGALDTSIPFVELKKLSHINPKAHVFGNDLEFSRKIREGLPNTGFLKKTQLNKKIISKVLQLLGC